MRDPERHPAQFDRPPVFAVRHRRKLVILACDRDFLLPTMLCCWQLRQQDRRGEAIDIALLHMRLGEHEDVVLRACAATLGVRTTAADHEPTDALVFNETHVPPSTLLRLQTAPLTEGYEQILYLDGDIQIVGPIADLLSVQVPEGRVLAAPDRFLLSEPTLGWRAAERRSDLAYLRGLGTPAAADYFNAGVMAAEAGTWRALCRDAQAYFVQHSQSCLYHDQSAFNAVAGGRLVRLSPAFNYHTVFRAIGAGLLQPRILHFTGGSKPWHSAACAQATGYDTLLTDFTRAHPLFASTFRGDRLAATPASTGRAGLKTRLYDRYTHYVRRRSFAAYLDRHGFADGALSHEPA